MDTTFHAKGSPSYKYSFPPKTPPQHISKITHWWDTSPGPPPSRKINLHKNLQTTCYKYTQGRQKESPSLNRAILACKPPPSSSPIHYCIKTHPLMQETYLHSCLGSIFPLLYPNSQITLQLWNFASPKFGFQSTSSLAAATNTMMYQYHNLPEGMRSISPEDIITFTKTLGTTYSDDVLHYIWLTRASANSRN